MAGPESFAALLAAERDDVGWRTFQQFESVQNRGALVTPDRVRPNDSDCRRDPHGMVALPLRPRHLGKEV